MKEEALNKNLPPKMSGGSRSGASTPSKSVNDEILSSLLRINNFDSISSLKDESLDIDLSACVTISADSAMMMSGNSLSTTDFWRVLDESAQNSQLDLTLSSDGETTNMRHEALLSATEIPPQNLLASSTPDAKTSKKSTNDYKNSDVSQSSIKKETTMTTNTFSGTFLRPEPPPPGYSNTFSPLKKIVKNLQQHLQESSDKPIIKKQPRKQSQQQQYKSKMHINCINFDNDQTNSSSSSKKSKNIDIHFIKEEPPEQLLMDALENSTSSPMINKSNKNNDNHNENNNNNNKSSNKINTSPTKFRMFMSTDAHNENTTLNNETFTTTANAKNNNNTEVIVSEELAINSIEKNNNKTSATDGGLLVEAKEFDISQQLFKCIDCDGLVLKGPLERGTHELVGHRVLFKCSVCIRDFEQESGLKKHMKTHRAVETRKDAWKKCPDCGKCLKLGSMWMHRKIHTENKKYGCEICGLKFVQKINLTHHARVHTAEKPYECPECQKRFQERSHLYRHQKYHAQTRSYRCEKCGKMYKTERCLKVHNLVHLEQRPFACTVCDKSFISNSKLKQHSNIHTGERPFKCNYCPRDFTNFPNWLKHTRRRHKVDHKTGEQLENIPSYCSKKSTKPAQPKKTTTMAAASRTADDTTSKTTTTATNNMITAATTTATTTTTKTTASTKPTSNMKTTIIVEKAPIKRKKKPNNNNVPLNAQENPNNTNKSSNNNNNNTNNIIEAVIQNSLEIETCPVNVVIPTIHNQQLNVVAATNNISIVNNNNNIKPTKIKRERKQAAPKQVQKIINNALTTTTHGEEFVLPTTLSVNTMPSSLIKREIDCTTGTARDGGTIGKTTTSNNLLNSFTDLHCLSITSAEELIMEQALEMEESGLFDARRPSTMSAGMAETDNAVSATEASAALHFSVKNEVESEEEFISIKDNRSQMLCSSLESSPYSSPASIELCSVATQKNSLPVEICTSTTNQLASNSSIYLMPANFQLHHSTLPANITLINNNNNNNSNNNNNNNNSKLSQGVTSVTLMPQQSNSLLNAQRQLQQNQQIMNFPAALINQLYMPTVNSSSGMMLPLSTNQVLPSVDTLLFSAAAAAAASRVSPTTTTSTSTIRRAATNSSSTTTTTSARHYRAKGVTPNNQS